MGQDRDRLNQSIQGALRDPTISADAMRWSPEKAEPPTVLSGFAGFVDFLNLPLPTLRGVDARTVRRTLTGIAERVSEEARITAAELKDLVGSRRPVPDEE